MISYAQNFEDVILNRVFRDRKDGFYIDVGAMDPVLHSVTKFFYDEGWCGINIEPNEWFFNKLAADRVRDINLNLAIGDHDEDNKPFYVFQEYGLSTFDETSRDRFVELGFTAERKDIKVSTMAEVCRDHADRPIDFLKVDCEGWERLALAGADWERFRPTVVVVEATEPLTTVSSYAEWESILIEAQYDMVYFDGLNRFYLRHESPGLREHFGVPPNVFDEFKVYATETAERERDELVERIVGIESRLRNADNENQRLGLSLQATEGQMVQVRNSLEAAAQALRMELEKKASRIGSLEKECRELGQALVKARLWVGQLSQDLAASKQLQPR